MKWRCRTPRLVYYLLDGEMPHFEYTTHLGLDEVYEDDEYSASAIDEVNKLLLVADPWRAKSYAWANTAGEIYESALPTHTLDTHDHDGPLSVFAPGRIIRAGTGSVAFWNLDDLETHGPEGNLVIGEPQADFHTEVSSGSEPTTIIPLADATFAPSTWHIHPNRPGTMLCGSANYRTTDYGCISLDLDAAKPAARCLGHSHSIEVFSTSEADPTVFLTAAQDGYVRLYDTRIPLPTLSIRAETCRAAVLVHPDGIPRTYSLSPCFLLPTLR
jgi:WD40 repeat protein